MPIPPSLHRYFWNCKVDELDKDTHKHAIIETLLEHGNIDAWRWMLKTYPKDTIIPILQRSRAISPRSKSFWGVYFHIDFPGAHVREGSPWWNRASDPDDR